MPPSLSNRVTQPVRNWKVRSPGGRLNGRNRKESPDAAVIGRQLQVAPAQETGQPAIAPAQIQNQDTRLILQRLNEQEVERKTLARPRRPEDEGVPDIPGKEVIEEWRLPLRFERRECRGFKVAALFRAARRAE